MVRANPTYLYENSRAILAFARHTAREAVRAAFRREGRKLHEIGFKHICIAADDYLKAHAELIEQAAQHLTKLKNICTSQGGL